MDKSVRLIRKRSSLPASTLPACGLACLKSLLQLESICCEAITACHVMNIACGLPLAALGGQMAARSSPIRSISACSAWSTRAGQRASHGARRPAARRGRTQHCAAGRRRRRRAVLPAGRRPGTPARRAPRVLLRRPGDDAVAAGIALSPSLAWLTAAAFLFGASTSCFDVAINALGAVTEKAAGRSIMSMLHAWFCAGALAGALLGSLAAGARCRCLRISCCWSCRCRCCCWSTAAGCRRTSPTTPRLRRCTRCRMARWPCWASSASAARWPKARSATGAAST